MQFRAQLRNSAYIHNFVMNLSLCITIALYQELIIYTLLTLAYMYLCIFMLLLVYTFSYLTLIVELIICCPSVLL